jgi:Ala-tRNA(Pro) deacylase
VTRSLAGTAAVDYPARMLTTRDAILNHLTELGIEHRTLLHPPVFTVEQAQEHTHHLPGGHCKNLFLKDRKDGLWLVTCRDQVKVDLNRLARSLGAPRFSFGRAELLAEVLGVSAGSVTPLALVNDPDGRVRAVLDTGLLAYEWVNCHPLQNDATVTMRATDLERFVRTTGHVPLLVDFDRLANDEA